MNNASVAEQKQIFEASLEGADLDALNALVARHKTNAALTQQLALDASRLVTTTQERLAQQAGAGFFKRFTSAISGKTSENQAQNQIDMLRMQKFAWHYLQQLQQQNLINAQSIAVIRNNLGTLSAYIIETRDFLEQAIDRIDQRLRHVENNTSFNNWSLNIEANKRRLKSNPRTLLTLSLTYGFMRSHPGILLSERDVNNYLVNALEKLDINCDEEVTLIDFIGDLIDQIEFSGIDHYRDMIQISFDEHIVDSDFIQKNISGTGFNALYFLSDHYERIVDLTSDHELANSDEARARIIAKFFGNEFSALATPYSIRHLICEIIGGSQLAVDVFKEAKGLNAAPEQVAEAPQQKERVALVPSLPEIQAHTFFDGKHRDESKQSYLLSLALCVGSSASLTPPALDFFSLLSAKAGHPGMEQDLVRLADNPRKLNEYQPVMQALLDDEDKKLTWLLDAFFLLNLAQEPIENPQVRAVLGILKPAQLKELLPSLVALIDESDSSRVLEAALKLAPFTQGWKNLVRYRELRFENYFGEAMKGLNATGWANVRIALDLGEVYRKGLEHAYFFSFSDGGLMSNLTDKGAAVICSVGRKSAIAGLNELRKKTKDFLSEHRSALDRANGLVSRWGIPSFEFKDEIGYAEFDLDNSAENEEWGSHFDRYYNQIQGTLDSFEQACNDAAEQLKFFIAGDFDQSVFALKEEKRTKYLSQQQQEKLEKQSVTITKDGAEHRFTIDWQQVAKPPCAPDQISHIETDGKVWLIVASINSDEVFYRSEDGEHWRQIQIDTPQFKVWLDSISVVNGVWIIRNRALRQGTRPDGIYYSSDAQEWRHHTGPGGAGNASLSMNEGHLAYKNIIYFKGMWLWAVTQLQKYSYTEKGFFTDSTKTDSYNKTILFAAQTLGDAWQRWDQSPQFNEGVEVNTICSLPGDNALLAFCEYSSSYIRNKKKPDTPPFVMYFGAAKLWQTCGWDGSRRFYSSTEPVFVQQDDKLMCFLSGEILVSPKGYDWNRQETRLTVDKHLALQGTSLVFDRNGSAVYLSQDGKQFKELALDEGTWRYLAANQGGMLGVYYANKHEETVLRVGRYICQAKL